MAGIVGKFVVGKILKESAQNKFGQEDPYFENVPATSTFGHKSRRVRKALPPGISENDSKVLTKVKRRAYRLDNSFNICGIRCGWSSIIGIIPFIGDFADVMLAMLVVNSCRGVDGGLPASIKTKMMMNIIVDFVVGLIPILGDVVDVFFRANTRNAIVLESFLRDRGSQTLKKQGKPVGVDMSLPENNPPDEDTSKHPDNRKDWHDPNSTGNSHSTPERAVTRGSRSSWFGGRRDQEPDVEMQRNVKSSSKKTNEPYQHPTTLAGGSGQTAPAASGVKTKSSTRR